MQKHSSNLVLFLNLLLSCMVSYQEIDLKRNQQENARLAYAAGADYKTVIGIQALEDNLTRSEFAQTEFMRQKLAEGGNVDALFALYERRASKAFINNIAVAQNTAHGYGIAAQQEMLRFEKENPGATVEEKRRNIKAFETEYFANITGADGRGLNANLMTTYVAPTMRRIQTGFDSQFNKQQRAEQESIVRQNFMKGLDHAWNTGGAAKVYKYLTEKGIANKANFEMYAEWRTNKSLDFGPTGLDSKDMEALDTFVFKDANGNDTTYLKSRGMLSDGAKSMVAYNARIAKEKQLYRDAAAERTRQFQSNGVEIYNEVAADGSMSDEDLARLEESDRASGIPGFESEATKLARTELDKVRNAAAYEEAMTEAADSGNVERLRYLLGLKGVNYKLRQKFTPVLENADILLSEKAYKDGVTTISNAITEYDLVAKGRIGNKDHYTTLLFKADQLQQFKDDVLIRKIPIQDAVSGRLGIISAKQATPGAINKYGHYTEMVQSQAQGAVNYQEALQKDRDFIESSQTPDFRKDPAAAVNAYGENDFYEDYYPMQRGEVTSQLRRRAAIMGVSPLAAINFLAGGLGQPAVAMDARGTSYC